ncbi:hypothetical protein [Sphingomonas sp. Root710]|uniref:hypothetical protein n=1 Tax=Sphingomonas sp. Root710 TaxID=1736594 RepID=UPI000A7BADAA|nr:hypothetical protein [Sphingomonas sp. Root710]
MGIRKRPDSGQYFIEAPKARSSRQRYEKTPLVAARAGILWFLKGIFSRNPRPFVASAIADKIDNGLNISRQVLKSGAILTPGSRLFESVADQLRQHAVEAYRVADNALDQIDDNLKQEAAWLDEAKPDEILSTLETKLEDRRVKLHTDLLSLASELVKSRVKLEEFLHRYKIPEDYHWGKRLDLAVFGQIGVLLLIEFLMNAVFQADTQQTGLIGGVLIASLTSLATIILGMLFGIGFQRTNKIAQGGVLVGLGLIALAFVLSFIFVSSLSLVRIAGESGDLHPLETARAELMGDPFAGVRAMLDLPAFAYTLCICSLISAVARKYLQYGGAFPGGRKRMLDFLDAEDSFEDQYSVDLDDAKEIAQTHAEMLEEAPRFIVACKVPIQTLVADHENVVEQHSHDIDDIHGAARLFTAFIRENGFDGDVADAALPPAEVKGSMQGHLDKLSQRHRLFVENANNLCEREDVSQSSVVAARERLNDLVEAKLAEYALERERIVEQALKSYQRSRNWRNDIMAAAARDKGDIATLRPEKI